MQLSDIKLPAFFTLAAMQERFLAVPETKLQKQKRKKATTKRKKKQTGLVAEIAALAAKLQSEEVK